MTKILEKDYIYAYWLKVDLSNSEFENFIKNIEQMELVDGIDIQDKEICLKFNHVKPKTISEINKAKEMNERNCKRFLSKFSKVIDGRLYFNVNHKTIKRK